MPIEYVTDAYRVPTLVHINLFDRVLVRSTLQHTGRSLNWGRFSIIEPSRT